MIGFAFLAKSAISGTLESYDFVSPPKAPKLLWNLEFGAWNFFVIRHSSFVISPAFIALTSGVFPKILHSFSNSGGFNQCPDFPGQRRDHEAVLG
jgi:hypothetical protein